MNRNGWLILGAVVAFVLALLLTVVDDNPNPELISALLFGGLASFAAGHLPQG